MTASSARSQSGQGRVSEGSQLLYQQGCVGLKAAPASAACSWQGCGTHRLGHMQTLGGCIITEPAVSHTGTPNIPHSVLHFCCSPPKPQSQTGRGLRKGRNFFFPFSNSLQDPPLSFCRASPALATPAALPAPLGPSYIGQSFCTTSRSASAHMLLTLLSSTSQHIHLQGNSLKGYLDNSI